MRKPRLTEELLRKLEFIEDNKGPDGWSLKKGIAMFKFKGSPNNRIVVLAVWDDNSCTAHLCLNNEEDVKSALDSVSNPIHAKRWYIGNVAALLDGDYLDSDCMEEYCRFEPVDVTAEKE
jgi:hypothetical protein